MDAGWNEFLASTTSAQFPSFTDDFLEREILSEVAPSYVATPTSNVPTPLTVFADDHAAVVTQLGPAMFPSYDLTEEDVKFLAVDDAPPKRALVGTNDSRTRKRQAIAQNLSATLTVRWKNAHVTKEEYIFLARLIFDPALDSDQLVLIDVPAQKGRSPGLDHSIFCTKMGFGRTSGRHQRLKVKSQQRTWLRNPEFSLPTDSRRIF